MLAVDMIKSKNDSQYKVIEASIFIQIDTAEQLKVYNVPGYYELVGDEFVFKPGKYWIQELALHEIIKKWIENN